MIQAQRRCAGHGEMTNGETSNGGCLSFFYIPKLKKAMEISTLIIIVLVVAFCAFAWMTK